MKNKLESQIAVKLTNVSKRFKKAKEVKNTLKSYFLNPFRKLEYEKFTALESIDFEVEKGEFIGIIGRNGSGKTTLLRIISGIYEPDSGHVLVNGKFTPFLELGVGFSPELSARDNIFLNGVILGMKRREIEEKFNEIVEFAEIEEFIDSPLKNFSSGMQVRLAFSIAIQTNAEIYLLDEVLAVGDANFQEKCLHIIESFKKDKKTILFVSHDMEDIGKFCDRVMVIDKGKKVFFGHTEKAISKYMNITRNRNL